MADSYARTAYHFAEKAFIFITKKIFFKLYKKYKNSKRLLGSCSDQPGGNCILFMGDANETVCLVRQKEGFVITVLNELTPSILVS